MYTALPPTCLIKCYCVELHYTALNGERSKTPDCRSNGSQVYERAHKVIDIAGILQKVLSIQVHGHLKLFKKLKYYFWFINIS